MTRHFFSLSILLICFAASGCVRSEKKYTKIQPAKVEKREGEKLPYVVLTPEAETRLGIQTEKLIRTPGKQSFQVPASSVLYDEKGRNWIYVRVGDSATFHRTEIELVKVEGSFAFVSTSEKEGSSIVTVGAAELIGTESGVGK